MSMQGSDEVTLRAFINSVWFKGLSRGAMIFTSVAFAVFLIVWSLVAGNTEKRVAAVDLQVQAVGAKVDDRAKDGEQFQSQTTADLTAVKADIQNLKVDVRVVRTILQQMVAAQNPHAAQSQVPFLLVPAEPQPVAQTVPH